MPPRTTASRVESLSVVPYYVGFVIAGMATVLLGAILPVLSTRWSLTDLQAGSLFAAQFTPFDQQGRVPASVEVVEQPQPLHATADDEHVQGSPGS